MYYYTNSITLQYSKLIILVACRKITASQFPTPNPWYLQGDRTKKTAKSPISLDYPSSCHLSGIGLDKLIHPLLASSKTPFAHTHSSGNVSLGNDTY